MIEESSVPSAPSGEPEFPFRYWPSLPSLGMLWFLGSLTFFFGAIILAYAFRFGNTRPDFPISVPAALWASTILLIMSGLTLGTARFAIRRGQIPSYRLWVGGTAILGGAFLLSQFLACRNLALQGLFGGSPFVNVVYVFAAFHALHLFGGLAALLYLLQGAATLADGEEQPIRRNRKRAGVVALYWNFVIVSWLVMFALMLWWLR